jgi:transcription termination factor Rho
MSLNLSELRSLPIAELVERARGIGIDNAGSLKKQELIFELVRREAGGGGGAVGTGVLETLPDGFGFLRSPDCNYLPGPDDIYVSPSQIRRFNLRTGDLVQGLVRAPKDSERYFALIKIEAINARSPEAERNKLLFDNLTPVIPSRRLWLGGGEDGLGIIDQVAPMAYGQRVLLLAPPRAGRTRLISAMVRQVQQTDPEAEVMVLLVDERPEEVTALGREHQGTVVSSTFDEPATRHCQVAEMALERARRMVEQGRDVVLFVDSLTRLARSYNATAATGGRVVEGMDVQALHSVRRFFGAGRCLEEGGSLTIVATAQVGAGPVMDQTLVSELEGTANVEIVLHADLAARGVFPAVDAAQSFTRYSHGLLKEDEIGRLEALRAQMSDDVIDNWNTAKAASESAA